MEELFGFLFLFQRVNICTTQRKKIKPLLASMLIVVLPGIASANFLDKKEFDFNSAATGDAPSFLSATPQEKKIDADCGCKLPKSLEKKVKAEPTKD